MSTLEKNIMRPRKTPFKKIEKEFDERVLQVSRVSRVVKGGRRIRFRALVAIGDRKGRVGVGIGKANEVSIAVQKASTKAKKNLISVPIINGTIPYEMIAENGAAKVLMRPATPGSTIVAGGAVRSIIELSGITDILAKILGSKSLINNSLAVISGLSKFNPDIVSKLQDFDDKSQRKILKKAVNIQSEKVDVKQSEKDINVPAKLTDKKKDEKSN